VPSPFEPSLLTQIEHRLERKGTRAWLRVRGAPLSDSGPLCPAGAQPPTALSHGSTFLCRNNVPLGDKGKPERVGAGQKERVGAGQTRACPGGQRERVGRGKEHPWLSAIGVIGTPVRRKACGSPPVVEQVRRSMSRMGRRQWAATTPRLLRTAMHDGGPSQGGRRLHFCGTGWGARRLG
jgi:hypothetical protein